MTPRVFRFAPSPNGRLHLGHAYSALVNFVAAREAGGRFLVRIEDIDFIRCRRGLGRQALEDLAWLGLSWEEPVRWQGEHLEEYRAAQARLRDMALLYPCFCSRAAMAQAADPARRDPEGQVLYPGTCRHPDDAERAARVAREPHAWRLDMAAAVARLDRPLSWEEEGTGRLPADAAAWGDVVLARKDIGTSYHVAVVVDDALQGVSDVIRGSDLYHATAIHRLLQELLALPEPRYRHHALIGDETGRKLAKSQGDRSLAGLREAGVTPGEIRAALGFSV